MVTYTLQKYNGDASKVFVTGSSSGAMMTVCLYLLELLNTADILTERHGRHVSGDVCRCYCIQWCSCWMLRLLLEPSRCVEFDLCAGQLPCHGSTMG